LQRSVKVLPGETALAFYRAKNTGKEDLIGIATYNMTPEKVSSSRHSVYEILVLGGVGFIAFALEKGGGSMEIEKETWDSMGTVERRPFRMIRPREAYQQFATGSAGSSGSGKLAHHLGLIRHWLQIAAYFAKVECFCFEEQRIRAGEEVDLPVFFFIDRDIMDDPGMDRIDDVILSYTFFR
jgi:hypothetical protein